MAVKPENEMRLSNLFAADIAQLRAVTALALAEWIIPPSLLQSRWQDQRLRGNTGRSLRL